LILLLCRLQTRTITVIYLQQQIAFV